MVGVTWQFFTSPVSLLHNNTLSCGDHLLCDPTPWGIHFDVDEWSNLTHAGSSPLKREPKANQFPFPSSQGALGGLGVGGLVVAYWIRCSNVKSPLPRKMVCCAILFGPWPYTNIFLSLSLSISGQFPLLEWCPWLLSLAAKGGAPSLHAFVSLSYLRNLWGYLGFF